MEENYIKLISKYGNQRVEFTIDPDIDMTEMVSTLECFLKAIGYQFNTLEEWINE
jgi:hypothetical protein